MMSSEQFQVVEHFLSNFEFYLVCLTVGVLIHAGFTLYSAVFRD